MSLFELADFAPPAPAWAAECFYCSPGDDGYYDEERHLHSHLPLTCAVCGEVSPNRLLFEMSHCVNLGASWGSNTLLCSSLALRLNHLLYDARHGDEPAEMDKRALALGWRVDAEGIYPPEGWPDGSHAVKCAAVAVPRCACGHLAVQHHGVDRGESGGCFGNGGLLDPDRCVCRLTCGDVQEAAA